jgi:hypothetical protein
MARDIMILMCGHSPFKRAIERGWVLKLRLFWALKWQQAKRVTFGSKKSRFQSHILSNGQSNGLPASQSLKVDKNKK